MILYRREGDVACVSFNRPDRLNAVTYTGVPELVAALDQAVSDGARAIVLTGEGRGFCSGFDLLDMDIEDFAGDVSRWIGEELNPLFARIAALPVPLVTAVNGPAAGAGCSLALYGDVVIAARSAYFYQSFVDIGLHPDAGATWILPRLVGLARASRMLLMGERIDAETAVGWGMIHEAVEDETLSARAMAVAAGLAAKPTVSVGLIRRAMRDATASSFADALAVEATNQGLAAQTEDFRTAMAAFRTRTTPRFTGR